MNDVFSKLIEVLTPRGESALRAFVGKVEGEDPLLIEVSGEPLPFFTKNSGLILRTGDKCLCLFDDENIYIICKVG